MSLNITAQASLQQTSDGPYYTSINIIRSGGIDGGSDQIKSIVNRVIYNNNIADKEVF